MRPTIATPEFLKLLDRHAIEFAESYITGLGQVEVAAAELALVAHIDAALCQARATALEDAAAAVAGMGSTTPIMSYGALCAAVIRALEPQA